MNQLSSALKKIPLKKWIAAILLLAVLLAAGMFIRYKYEQHKEAEYLANYGQTAMTVGEYKVTYDLYRYFYLNYAREMEDEYTDPAALDRAVRAQIERAVCGLYGTVALAGDHGITTEDADVRASAAEYVEAVKTYYKEQKLDFAKDIAANNMSEELFVFFMRVDALENKLFSALVQDGGVIENDDAKLLELFRGEEFVRAKQIFIENDEGEDVENNRAIAAEALAAYKDGTEFDVLIGRYSEDLTMPDGGYYFTRKEMIPAFENAAFTLKDGEISDVVESEDGFHIILRLQKDEDYLQLHFADMKTQYQDSAFYRLIDARAATLVATETDYVRSLSYEEIH